MWSLKTIIKNVLKFHTGSTHSSKVQPKPMAPYSTSSESLFKYMTLTFFVSVCLSRACLIIFLSNPSSLHHKLTPLSLTSQDLLQAYQYVLKKFKAFTTVNKHTLTYWALKPHRKVSVYFSLGKGQHEAMTVLIIFCISSMVLYIIPVIVSNTRHAWVYSTLSSVEVTTCS